jgi:Zn-dependent metalloprotease
MTRRLIPVAVTASLLAVSPVAGAGQTVPRIDRGPGWDARAHAVAADAGAAGRPARTVAWAAALRELRGDSTRRLVVRAGGGTEPAAFVSARVPFARFTGADGAAARAEAFLAEYGEAFGVSAPEAQLELVEVRRDELGMTHLRFAQRHRGIPVIGRGLAVHLGAAAVIAANGEFAPGVAVDTTPSLTARAADRIARRAVPGTSPVGEPALVVNVDEAGEARLAWRVGLRTERPLGDWRVVVDAGDGIVLDRWNRIPDVRDVRTLDARNSYVARVVLRSDLGDPLDPAFQPSPPSGDAIADATHVNALAVYDYFHDVLGWDSLAEPGFSLRAVVHVGRSFPNAYWDPADRRMYFGDGGGCFRAFGRALDVVAHEFTHGVIESTSDLRYSGDAGALNESYADVMGAMVDDADWEMGEALDKCGAGPIRDLADPSRLGQPEHVGAYVDTPSDNRGVHINSGIPNHAAYLTASAIGREKTAQIYYRAMTAHYLTPGADFTANRAALMQAATDLFGAGPEAAAVTAAQDAVGVTDETRPTRLAGVLPRADRVLRAGGAVTISGRLLDDDTGLGIAGRRVDIQTSGGTFMSGRTGADGRWQLRLPRPVPYNISWRAIFRGGGGLEAATATTRHMVLIRPRLTAYTNLPRRGGHYRVRSGVRFQLMGSSAPRMWGAVVTTQYRWSQRARWRVLGRAYVGRDGRFGGPLRLTGADSTLWVRHVYNGGRRAGWLDGRSQAIAIDVR